MRTPQTANAQRFFGETSGQLNERGDPRTKALARRIFGDAAKLIGRM